MKPETAAKKLGIYLPAAPTEFQEGPLTRDDLLELQSNPPEWLQELRRTGPHPRAEVARKLGVSNSGLARADAPDVLTTAEIKALLEEMPEWLVTERATFAAVREDAARTAEKKAEKAEKAEKAVKAERASRA
ncbi:DUF5997 family protein [Labedella gwakjiensis]|nr:DUF5997 family protein [Labedella gwakjiensis]